MSLSIHLFLPLLLSFSLPMLVVVAFVLVTVILHYFAHLRDWAVEQGVQKSRRAEEQGVNGGAWVIWSGEKERRRGRKRWMERESEREREGERESTVWPSIFLCMIMNTFMKVVIHMLVYLCQKGH